jgi:ubiquinone/menaquinone biosynthesis C-methylase UbiE
MSFDRLARHYRWMEYVLAGNKLQRCRTAYLDQVREVRRALIAGEGNGRFLSAFLEANPSVQVTCVDGSARMLDCARVRLRREGRRADNVEFIHADILAWTPPPAQFDLLATHFFLDCFPPVQLEIVLARLGAAAVPEGHWLISDFREPRAGPAKWRARSILAVMYLFFRCVTRLPARRLTAPDTLLERHGFALQSRRLSEWGLLHADLWRAAGARSNSN